MTLWKLCRPCQVVVRHPVCLYITSVLSVGLLVLLFQPMPVNVPQLRMWQQSFPLRQVPFRSPPPAPYWTDDDRPPVLDQAGGGGDGREAPVGKMVGGRGKEGRYRNGSQWPGYAHLECIGADPALNEVEDLLCLPKPNFDPSMKNPCWWEENKPQQQQQQQQPVQPHITNGSLATNSSSSHGSPSLINTTSSSSAKTLSCLPYFHILCCSKSGTTDMFRRISIHPDIVPNFGIFGKERLWWSWGKYGFANFWSRTEPVPFEKYVKGFGILARDLQKAVTENPKDLKRLVTLDGSPPDMWDLRGWSQLPQNRNLRQPAVMTPHLMRHLYRQPKFLVLVREPVERLYTSYLFHGFGRKAEDFHEDSLLAIARFDRCLSTAENRIECFVNDTILQEMPVFLQYSCYSVYFKEWLKVFPREQFLFIRTEDYSEELKDTLFQIFKFLEIPRPSTKDMQKMMAAPISYHTRQRDLAGPMLNETRDLLKRWYQPWKEELANLLEDKKWLWDDLEQDT